ncbi:hypothetical protein AB0N16_31420 [Streptomyces sp. NPDC051105]|uniref:hypothetical protein n=1 Tax=Streptomyces sp. NPDC051105 TaxID=3154843 RepID=UPI00342F0B81
MTSWAPDRSAITPLTGMKTRAGGDPGRQDVRQVRDGAGETEDGEGDGDHRDGRRGRGEETVEEQ